MFRITDNVCRPKDKRGLRFEYGRFLDNHYHLWSTKRNTGMKVSWHFEPTPQTLPDLKFAEDNSNFIHLANVIHKTGDIQIKSWYSKAKKTMIKIGLKCTEKKLVNKAMEKLNQTYGHIARSAIYKEEISEETLETAAYYYYGMFFCPEVQKQMVDFYQNLFQNFSLEIVLKTLTRILSVAKERKLTQNYNTALKLFQKATKMMNLQYKNVIAITTRASELKLYKDLRTFKPTREVDFPSRLVNHPVHVSEEEKLSAFIPFCSFEDGICEDFQGSLCRIFREKVVSGQVCYEADINQFKNNVHSWKRSLQRGFSFIVDTNEEYDVKNIITNNTPTENVQHSASYHSGAAYKGKSIKFSYVKWT